MVIDRLHLCKCMKLRYSLEKKRPLPFDRVHKDSKWQKLFSRGHYHDYWFIYLCGSFVETISLFTGRRKRRVGGRFMGQLVHQTPPKYWHSNSVVVVVLWRQKCSTPGNIDIPTWAFYCLRPTVVSARCSPITLNCLPFRPPEGLFLTGKLLFIVSKAEKLVLERSHKLLTFTYSASCSFSVKFK